jgi:hypothetical protein
MIKNTIYNYYGFNIMKVMRRKLMNWKIMILMGISLTVLSIGKLSFAAGDGNFSLNRVSSLIGPKNDIEVVAFSPDGTLLERRRQS